jgi:N-acetyl-gamma-glutamylphosphate reductase
LNTLSKKLRALENNLLELPEDDDILLHIGDDDEQQLHEHARRIRDSLRVQAEEIINDTSLTLEQQNEMAKDVLSQLSEREIDILDESNKFLDYRLMRLVYKRFVSGYPHQKDDRVLMRVVWFFMEMEKQNHVNFFTDSEWEHNRNEDDPAFDDYA